MLQALLQQLLLGSSVVCNRGSLLTWILKLDMGPRVPDKGVHDQDKSQSCCLGASVVCNRGSLLTWILRLDMEPGIPNKGVHDQD